MAKGDDALRRKKNKVNRKKMNAKNDSATVSSRVAAIIAAKKRRLTGKRRMCQGMCFSLPTLEDPFNDRNNKKIFQKEEKNKFDKEKSVVTGKETFGRKNPKGNKSEKTEEKTSLNPAELVKFEIPDSPSKFLILCLKEIENSLTSEEENSLFNSTWGVEFWKCFSIGKNILDNSGSSSTTAQKAWIVSIAADTITRKEKEGLTPSCPFLLFLVPSQDKTTEVRTLCKPLKALGLHTVSLHAGASLDHQTNGLKRCEPEFIVSTPERLLELVSLKAIDISGVSILVIDGLQSLCEGGYLDALKSIQKAISGKPCTVVFNDSFRHDSISTVQNILMGPICRLSLNDSVASQSACIIQSVNTCLSNDEKLLKSTQALDLAYGNNLLSQPMKVLYIIKKEVTFQKLSAALKLKGYSITGLESEIKNSEERHVSVIDTEEISSTDLEAYEVILLPDFVASIQDYVEVVTRMGRSTVNGELHSFLTKYEASLYADALVEILAKCGQAVPENLRKLCSKSPMLE